MFIQQGLKTDFRRNMVDDDVRPDLHVRTADGFLAQGLARLIGKAFEVLLVRDHELGIVWADFADQSALGDCVLFVFVVDAIQHVVNVNAALGFLARDVPLDDWDFDGREGGHLNLLRECLLLSNFKEKLATDPQFKSVFYAQCEEALKQSVKTSSKLKREEAEELLPSQDPIETLEPNGGELE